MNFDKCEVLGVGTPILDLFIHVDHAFLELIEGEKGGAKTVDYETFCQILKESNQNPLYAMGGSAANTIKGLANLGRKCAFAGKIGNDDAGKVFLKEMALLNITPHLLQTNIPTAQVVSLISPDRERTMRSFLGSHNELQPENIQPEVIKNASLVHIEGYLLSYGSVVETVMKLAKGAGAKISFNLGSFEITNYHKKLIIDLVAKYVDILFVNEMEGRALTHLDPEKGCDLLKDLCETAVVTMGKEGCWAGRGTEKAFEPAYLVDNVVDTTGAGDLYASGFLHGYLSQKSLSECARSGNLVAAGVLHNYGVSITPEKWQEIKAQL